MASIVAYIELREGAITRPSRFVVAEARRVADSAGATVFALLMVGPLAQMEMDQLASEISAAGADRILCSSADTLEGPALDVSHGALLAQVAEHLRPLLFLFPAGDSGAQLGPPLSVRIGAAFMANARLDVYEEDRTPEPASQRVLVSRWRAARDGQRRIDVGDLERPVVASLDSGPFPPPAGEPYAEVEMVPCPDAKFPDARVVDSEMDTAADLERCQAMVLSGTPSGAASAAFRAELPVGTCLVTTDEAGAPAIRVAAPRDLFVLPSAASTPAAIYPPMGPGSVVTHVKSGAGARATDSSTEATTAAADADLAELASAIRRARTQGAAS
jgi:electron transfer flavoprotein alpha subunit